MRSERALFLRALCVSAAISKCERVFKARSQMRSFITVGILGIARDVQTMRSFKRFMFRGRFSNVVGAYEGKLRAYCATCSLVLNEALVFHFLTALTLYFFCKLSSLQPCAIRMQTISRTAKVLPTFFSCWTKYCTNKSSTYR